MVFAMSISPTIFGQICAFVAQAMESGQSIDNAVICKR